MGPSNPPPNTFLPVVQDAVAEVTLFVEVTNEAVPVTLSYPLKHPTQVLEMVNLLVEALLETTKFPETVDVPEVPNTFRYPCSWLVPDVLPCMVEVAVVPT